jgi:hypothetical protein
MPYLGPISARRFTQSLLDSSRENIMRLVIRILTPVLFLLAMLLPAGGAVASPPASHGGAIVYSFSTCNGELIVGEGFAASVFKTQQDGSVLVHYTIHATAVGNNNEYVLNLDEFDQLSASGDYSSDFRVLMVSKGSAPNEWLLIHFDPVTGVTVTSDCRG